MWQFCDIIYIFWHILAKEGKFLLFIRNPMFKVTFRHLDKFFFSVFVQKNFTSTLRDYLKLNWMPPNSENATAVS